MNANKRKKVEEYKAKGSTPKEAYDKMRAFEKLEVKIIGKRKEKKA